MGAGKKVAVICGGMSSEREVSLDTGRGVYEALLRSGYEAYLIDVTGDMAAFVKMLQETRPMVVFNALHGTYGEDGNVQGLLNMLKLPYTHSGVLASAIAMDKVRAKTFFRQAGIPVARHVEARVSMMGGEDLLPRPFVLKPVRDGSSCGIFIVRDGDDLGLMLSGWKCGDEVMLEEYIPGRELTAACMDGRYMGMVEIVTDRDFYNYDAKYSVGGSSHIVPDDLPSEILKLLERYTVAAHNVLGCRGVTRSDFRYDPQTERLVILELNTQPGMTATSLVPDIGRNAGIGYDEIVSQLVEKAVCDI